MRADMAKFLQDVDRSKRLLEIGPLTMPLFGRDEADIHYADIRSTEQVRHYYENDSNVDCRSIVDIDFVISGSYSDSLRDVEKFDYVLMSHVLEHVPRLIEFFQDIAGVIREDGFLWLLLPDHRYCFDHFRQPTSFAETYYVHIWGLPVAPWRVMESCCFSASVNNAHFFWQEKMTASVAMPKTPPSAKNARRIMEEAAEGRFPSIHFSVFSPRSFLLLLHDMVSFRLLPFSFETFFPTPKNEFTFAVVLKLCPKMRLSNELAERELVRYRKLLDALALRESQA